MLKYLSNKEESAFTFLLGFAFASLFFRQGLIHLSGLMFLIALFFYRPRLPWIGPFWWLIGFLLWEWISHYAGPYPGLGIEGGGIGYHFFYVFLPMTLLVLPMHAVARGVLIGAGCASVLIWVQGLIGVDLDASPLRINWDGGELFSRPPGFNRRAWETQFIFSMVFLTVFMLYRSRGKAYWFTMISLISGVLLPQIRAVFAAFIVALSWQIIFRRPSGDVMLLLRKLGLIALVAIIGFSAMAYLRPNFSKNLLSGNGRDKIFVVSFEVVKEFPLTGVGGGEYFKEHYQKAWLELGWSSKSPLFDIGHAHNDMLMMLAHHGWPMLLLWLGFVLHSLLFVWKHGKRRDKVLFSSLVIMHHFAGLAETYMDYSNTTYAIMLCYGMALHGPTMRWKKQRAKLA